MSDLVEIRVVCTVERALKKLHDGGIPVYRLREQGAKLSFCVREEYVEKVFAIFAHRCYNIGIGRFSAKKRLVNALIARIGLVIGALLFIAVALMANALVLRIEVTGNGAYLAPDVIAAARECGFAEWTTARNADAPALSARVLSMNGVTFCSVKRKGSCVVIEVVCGDEGGKGADYRDFISPEGGTVVSLVAVCGTPLVEEGQEVAAGDRLIGAYSLSEDGTQRPCLAAGFVRILVTRSQSVFFTQENEDNAAIALGITSLYCEKAESKSYTVSPCEGGYVYDVTFTYIYSASINME